MGFCCLLMYQRGRSYITLYFLDEFGKVCLNVFIPRTPCYTDTKTFLITGSSHKFQWRRGGALWKLIIMIAEESELDIALLAYRCE